MAIVLLTQNNYDLPNIKAVKTFKNIDWNGVTCLIFHSSSDSDVEIALELSNLKGRIDKVLYINKNINPLYYCIFTGLDADIYDSEDYLMDLDALMYLIDTYKETGMTLKSPNSDVETLAKCVATISTSSFENIQKLVSNSFWVKTLNTAVSNVDNALIRANQVNIDVITMLSETSQLIGNLQINNEMTGQEIEKLSLLLEDMQQRQQEKIEELRQEMEEESRQREQFEKLLEDMEKKSRFSSQISIYATHKVPMTVKRVLYVRVMGGIRYLNSFLLSYRHYLRMEKQVHAKLLLVLPNTRVNIQRYKENNTFTRLAQDSLNFINPEKSDMYITYDPKKMVLDTFFDQSNVNLFIVVDYLMGDVILEGHQVETFYALSSISDVEKFKLDPKKCIWQITAKEEGVRIPHINKYTEANAPARQNLYYEKCKEQYTYLDKFTLKAGR